MAVEMAQQNEYTELVLCLSELIDAENASKLSLAPHAEHLLYLCEQAAFNPRMSEAICDADIREKITSK